MTLNGKYHGLGFYLLLCVLGLTACGAQQDPAAETVSGESAVARIEGHVFYRERMMLPPGAEVEVQLQDISRPDALATVISTLLLKPEGGPPYAFSMEYNPQNIDRRKRYALRATISVGDRLMFSSTDYIDPFSGNPVEVLVRRVAEPVQRSGPELAGPLWTLHTLGDAAAVPGEGGKLPDIQFLAGELRAAGFAGCNRFSGSYSLGEASQSGTALEFGSTVTTLMACEQGDEAEQAFLQMLGKVTAFRLHGNTLSLLAGEQLLATFKSD